MIVTFLFLPDNAGALDLLINCFYSSFFSSSYLPIKLIFSDHVISPIILILLMLFICILSLDKQKGNFDK